MNPENDFVVSTARQTERSFREVVGKPLYALSLFLSGIVGVCGLASCFWETLHGAWESLGAADCLQAILPVLVYLTAFLILLLMSKSRRPFSGTLVRGIYAIAVLYFLYSLVLPRLPDYRYKEGSLGILVINGRPLLDGTYLLPGLLFCILGGILRAGFRMQRELDETL
jgi:hypothetical protein